MREWTRMSRLRDAMIEGVENINRGDRYGWHVAGYEFGGLLIKWDHAGEIFRIEYRERFSDCWFECEMGDEYIDSRPVVTVGDGRGCDAPTREEGLRMIILLVARIARARIGRGK